MACLDNEQILPMMGMGPVSVYGHNAANPAMIKGENPKMLGKKDNGQTLIFIRTKGPGRHDQAFSEAKRFAEVIEPGHKLRIGHSQTVNLEWRQLSRHIVLSVLPEHLSVSPLAYQLFFGHFNCISLLLFWVKLLNRWKIFTGQE
jgi:hypothetical protein